MATVRAVAGASSGDDHWSLSKGFRDYLSCCFVSSTSGYSPSVTSKIQSTTVANDNDGEDCELGMDANLSDGDDVTTCDKEFKQDDEPDGGSRDQLPRDKPTADGNESRDVSFEVSVTGTERRAADGESIHSIGTDGFGSASGSGQGQVDGLSEGVRMAADGRTISSEETVPLVRNEPSRASTTTVSQFNATDARQVNSVPSTSDVDQTGQTGATVQSVVDDDSDQLTRSTSVLVVSQDELGQSVTYHESAIDVNLNDVSTNNSPADVTDVPVPDSKATPPSRDRLVTQCGCLRLSFRYELPPKRRNSGTLSVVVCDAVDLPNEDRGGSSHVQFHLVLLPNKKIRHKTRVRPGGNTSFDETFDFRLTPDDLPNAGLRIRLYGCERLRRERMVGECVIWCSSLGIPEGANSQAIERWVILQPRSNLSQGESAGELVTLGGASGGAGSTGSLSGASSDAGGSSNSPMPHGGLPELMIGLSYNQLTGRLTVEVIKGSNFRTIGVRPPDSQVKLAVMNPDGKPMGESKTSVRRGQPNPLFKETFMFQVALHQLPEISLLVSVYNVRTMKRKEMFGWFTIVYFGHLEQTKLPNRSADSSPLQLNSPARQTAVMKSRHTGQRCSTVTATLSVAGTSYSNLDDVTLGCSIVTVSVILYPVTE